MKLLSIKAHGFKSFADKIEINIFDGITGIVGPNGSGKSNVVDAVKWVLGESSLKEIRGGEQTSDVIFMGSSSRSPQSRAWVSLTFDNQDHYLATAYDTVEIKREVFKTGENQYYINNTKVRKKDITDLFLDSGANADSFSIISQGKIMEILKGKPSDRRVIIEEASGTLKYKKRKDETMRKLDNTNDNLEKVNLVINELSEMRESVSSQAEAAKKYLSFKEDLENIEIALIANDINDINAENDKAKTRFQELNDFLINMGTKGSLDDSKLAALKESEARVNNEINKLSEELLKVSEKLADIETRKQVIAERKKYAVDDQKLENNILALKEREIELKKALNLLEKEEAEFKSAKEQNDLDLDNLKAEYNKLGERKKTLDNELGLKSRALVNVNNKIDILNENMENDTKLPYAVKSVLNNPRLKGVHDVLVKLIDCEEKYVVALEVALGANQNVVVVDNEESAKEAINYLKDNKIGRATFFPINVIKERSIDEDTLKKCREVAGFINVASALVQYNPLYKNIIGNQLGQTLIVDNMETMNKLGRIINYRFRIITLDGELLHTGGAMSGGALKNTSGLINAKFELTNLIKEKEGLVNALKLLEEHINDIDANLSELETKIFELGAKITSINEQIIQKQKEIKATSDNLESCLLEIKGTDNILKNTLDEELDEVLKNILEVSSRKDELALMLNSKKTERDELVSATNEMELLNKKKNSEYNKSNQELRELEVAIAKRDVKLDNLLNRLGDEYQITYEKALNDYELDMDIEVARSKVNQLKRDIRELGEVNVGSIAEFERLDTRYQFLVEQKSDLERAIADLLEIITDLDETMKQKFAETFDKVNEEFSNVFKKLFKGGNAKLILTDPSDMLVTGVDISAEPPGKNLKSINTLSGGEMTLTAIALLFSILNIRVVPFCILDEVEAALDEANVDQFGTYIKEYEHNSQFIVITHKKRTMEYANTLYGITMQESGVSKLVSVKLENL